MSDALIKKLNAITKGNLCDPMTVNMDAWNDMASSASEVIEENAHLRQQLEKAQARIAELTEMFAQGFDADGDPDEWRKRAMKSIAGGLPSANAFIKRRQAYAIEDWLHGDPEMGNLDDYAQNLRDEADELEQNQ